MKSNRYNIFHKSGEQLYLYNQLSEALIEIDQELHDALATSNINKIPKDLRDYLRDICVIVDDNMEESDLVRFANQKCRYNTDVLRITILPTLACNFRCWYCYENHKSTRVTVEAMQAILTFIKEEVIAKGKKRIILDWFGGEPMLCFESVIFPFSRELMSWCKEKEITLHNITTSNGSLITEKMAKKMYEIGLSQFQITLDGGKEHHNNTRFSPTLKDSYSKIIDNIHILCYTIPKAHIELRINYTPENINSLTKILDEFNPDIRCRIRISPHIVWQKSDEIMNLSSIIDKLLQKAELMGYVTSLQTTTKRCITCYTENIDQYVINYDLFVYKCTARDYNQVYSIGKISEDGKFQPNGLYYKYMTTPSPFINKKCLQCDILSSCLLATSCIQKDIEGSSFRCCRSLIEKKIKDYLNKKIRMI